MRSSGLLGRVWAEITDDDEGLDLAGVEADALPGNLPRDVTVEEDTASLDELRELVLARVLRTTDFVNLDAGAGWQTVRDCWPLHEQVEAVESRRRRLRIALAVMGLAFVLLLAAVAIGGSRH